MKSLIISLVLLSVFSSCAHQSTNQTVSYFEGQTELEGRIYLPSKSSSKKSPAILIAHSWMGINQKAIDVAKRYADKGYVAFLVDIYGKGVTVKDVNEASKIATFYRSDRPLMRRRINSALEYIRQHPQVDSEQIAAIGFCFGGGVVLELARSGADLKQVISFHGNLDTPNPKDAKNIKAGVLVLHGDIDPYVPDAQITGFKKEMNDAGVKYSFVGFGGAVHSFTNPEAGSDISQGAAYDAGVSKQAFDIADLYLPRL